MGKKYTDAGVDIEKGKRAIDLIKKAVSSTYDENVISSLRQFAGIYKYGEDYLVSATDGVGTKLKLANELNNHKTIGIDLVAMSVNDIAVHGAKPLFFLDYLATGKLNPETVKDVVEGIAQGCKQAGCALLGGETAEMPGFYEGEKYDLAGFALGIAKKDEILLDENLKAGMSIIGIASSGPHSNGYSLIRKIIKDASLDLSNNYNLDKTLGETLLEPTKIYSDVPLLLKGNVVSIAHITGGGFYQNIGRILSKDTDALIAKKSWDKNKIFSFLQDQGDISEHEMYEVFNMGIGMVAVVNDSKKVVEMLSKKYSSFIIGEIVSGEGKVIIE